MPKKPALSMMFNAICPLKAVPKHFYETKIKGFHIMFCITEAYNKLLVQKVHLIMAESCVDLFILRLKLET